MQINPKTLSVYSKLYRVQSPLVMPKFDKSKEVYCMHIFSVLLCMFYVCVFMYIYMYIYVCIYICTYSPFCYSCFMSVYHIYIYIYVYIYIYIYI